MAAACARTGRARLVWGLVWAAALASARAQTPPAGAPGETLVDRTVAVVGGAVITQSDVDTAVALGLSEGGQNGGAETPTSRMIDRWLMLQEVARFAPAEPDPAAVEARVREVRVRVGGDEALATLLARAGVPPSRLTSWVRDDLRIAAYLDQRFASAGVPSDADVADYARRHQATLDPAGNTPPAEVLRGARERLVAERRSELVRDWLAELRRRTEVVEFRRAPAPRP